MNDIKAHAMYQGLEWDKLESKMIQAPWIPDAPARFPEPESINTNDIYTGNQVSGQQPAFVLAGSSACSLPLFCSSLGKLIQWYPTTISLATSRQIS